MHLIQLSQDYIVWKADTNEKVNRRFPLAFTQPTECTQTANSALALPRGGEGEGEEEGENGIDNCMHMVSYY